MARERAPSSLTIFFPCYNDAATIGTLVAHAVLVAKAYTDDYEIIVVDDGSTDNSRELLTRLREKYPALRLVLHDKNRGYGGAIQSGFAHAAKDLVFYTDGDGQYDVFELPTLLREMRDGVDVVNGYKIARSDPFHRMVIGAVYLSLMRRLFTFHMRDLCCDFRVLRRRVFETIHLRYTSGIMSLELIKKLELGGYRIVEVPIHHYHRLHGRSQFFNVRRLVMTGVDVLRLWWEVMVLRGRRVRVAYRERVSEDLRTAGHLVKGSRR